MTTPAIRTIKRGGSRLYINPLDGSKAVGVTSVVGKLPKGFLTFWAAKETATTAVDQFPALSSMVIAGDREGAIDWLKRAHLRITSSAAEAGTEVHELTEEIDLRGGMPKRVHRDLMPYARGYLAFRQQTECDITEVETTVWSVEHGYAGTLDRVITIPASAWGDQEPPEWWREGGRYIADVKTTRSGVHAEVGIQLAAYRMADTAFDQTSTGFVARPFATPEPVGLVVHLRPEGWQLVPVDCGPAQFDVFRALMVVHQWDVELSSRTMHVPLIQESWTEEDIADLAELLKRL